MNVLTGALFTIAVVFDWLLFIWWMVIIFLGADVRRELRKLNAALPECKTRYLLVSGLFNLVGVALTAGYFVETVYNFYVGHQLMVLLVAVVALIFSATMNDSLHHSLLHHIYCLDGAKKVVADELEATEKGQSLTE